MKNSRFLLLLLFCYTPLQANVCNSCPEFISHTFMFTRPITQHLGINQALWHDIIYNKHGKAHAALQSTAVFQESTRDIPTQQYFFYDCKNELLVAGDNVTLDRRSRDVRAEWLGLPSNFHGNFTLNPKQRQMGFFLEYNQDLGNLCGQGTPFKDSWVSVNIPLIVVENNLGIEQFDVGPTSTHFPSDIIEAFNQPNWLYAKMNGQQCSIGIADFNIKLGRTYLSDHCFQVACYSSLIFPTGNKQNPAYIFSPFTGSNGHFGYGVGANFQLWLNQCPSTIDWCLFVNLEGIFFAHNTQLRTFDLLQRPTSTTLFDVTQSPARDTQIVSKPMSRYLLFIEKDAPVKQVLIPGVNILTQKVQVHPYGFFDFSGGFRLKGCSSELEFGYNIWGHGPEKLYLRCPFPPKWGIAGTIIPETGEYGTASRSTIKNKAPNDIESISCGSECLEKPIFVPVDIGDLDFESAAARSAFNHKVHIAIGFVKRGNTIDAFMGGGIFYDLPMKNAALPLMGAWAKFGAAF